MVRHCSCNRRATNCLSDTENISVWELVDHMWHIVTVWLFASDIYSYLTYLLNLFSSSIVTVAGICNSVSGGIFLTWHHGVGGEYGLMSKLGLSIDIRIATSCWPFVLCSKIGQWACSHPLTPHRNAHVIHRRRRC